MFAVTYVVIVVVVHVRFSTQRAFLFLRYFFLVSCGIGAGALDLLYASADINSASGNYRVILKSLRDF